MHLAEEKCSEPDTGAPDFRWGQVPRNPSHVENIPSQKRFSSLTPPNPRAWPAAWNVRGAPRPRADTPVAASPSQQTWGARALASTMGLEPCPEALAGARPRGCGADGECGALGPASPDSTAPCARSACSAGSPLLWSWDVGLGTEWLPVVALERALQAACLASLCVAVKDCFPIPKKEGEAHVTALTNSCRPGQSPRHFSLLGWDPAFVMLATSACRRGAWSREGASGPPWTPAEETQPEAGVVSAGRPRSRCRGACVLLLPCSALPPWLSPSRLRSRVGPDSGATVEGPADVARRPPLAPPPGPKPPVTPPSFPSPGPRPHRQSSAGGLCVSAGFRYYS